MKIYILLMTILIWSQEVESKKRLILLCDRVEIMEIGNGSPMSFSEIDILYNETYGTVFNVDLILTRDLISSKLKVSMEMVKCAVKEAPDTCEYFTKLKPPNVCFFLNARNMTWSALTENFTPNLRCPLKKGTYLARGVTFDFNLWQMYPMLDWYWKVTTTVYEGKLLLYKLRMDGKVVPSRYGTV